MHLHLKSRFKWGPASIEMFAEYDLTRLVQHKYLYFSTFYFACCCIEKFAFFDCFDSTLHT